MTDAVNVSHLRADDWEHALVTGNGRQGAACYGGPPALHVALSHERLFLPVDEPLAPPDTGRVLPRLRELAFAGRFQQAADEVVALACAEDPRYGRLRHTDPFIGAATLTFLPHRRRGDPTGWRRQVDLATGLVTHEWADEMGGVRHEAFASRPYDVVAIRVTGDRPLSGRLHLGPLHGAPPAPIRLHGRASPASLCLTAEFPRGWSGSVAGYQVACRIVAPHAAGEVRPDLGGMSATVDGVDELLMLVRTTVRSAEMASLDAAYDGQLWDVPTDFDALLEEHASVHRALFDRCRLDLGGRSDNASTGDASAEDALTEDLLAGAATPALVERLFDAGRYAIICSSGELPPNLQGVWSGTFDPAWRGGYTLDGNLQAAVSALGSTGTPELLLPIFDLLDAFREDFRDNARRLYRAPGLLLPAHVTTHGRQNHFTSRWCLTFWTAGAAWAARLYYDYWRYTGDRAFLARRALPFMREAATFYAAFAQAGHGAEDMLCFAPSYSPENSPKGEDGPQASVNATMDVATVRDLLRNLLEGTRTLGLRDPEADGWQAMLDRLPAYRIDADASLSEWLWPGLPNNHAHRHASHLFGLWYEPDPALLENPALRHAAAEAVRQRLRWWRGQGDEMAFGLTQLGLAAAALGLVDEAHEVVSLLSTRYWRPNLVSTHNAGSIFNTDICGGLPAVVAAMLAGSHGDTVDLLPALPAAWPAGSVRGMLLRGGIRIERLAWSDGLVEANLRCREDRRLIVTAPDPRPGERARVALVTRAGQAIQVSFP